MARKLELLVIHCTATPDGRNVTPEDIRRWHLSPVPEGRGWRQVGYSDMIMLSGEVIRLVPYNNDGIVDPWEVTNGVARINSRSRHVVYVGGTDRQGKARDTRNPSQLEALKKYVLDTIRRNPHIKVAGHNQFAAKACPSFDVPSWLRSIGVQSINIYEKKG